MKNNKPEVLIIGEIHPRAFYLDLPQKTRILKIRGQKIPVSTVGVFKVGIKKLFKKVRTAGLLIDAEEYIIKDFGAKKMLFEVDDIGETNKIAVSLRKSRKVYEFEQELILHFYKTNKELVDDVTKLAQQYGIDTISYKVEGDIYSPKIIATLVARTKIFDIGFFDDKETSSRTGTLLSLLDAMKAHIKKDFKLKKIFKKMLDDLDELSKTREKIMVENIKKKLEDKTVVICGALHAHAVEKGLNEVAHVKKQILGK